MTPRFSSRLKSVLEKVKNYFTEQDEEYFSSQETDDSFVAEKLKKEIMESERRASLSQASCDGVSVCLYLSLLAIFALPSPCIKLYRYDFYNIVSKKIYCLAVGMDRAINLEKKC